MAKTFALPSAAQQEQRAFDRGLMSAFEKVTLKPDTAYGVLVIELDDTVDRPGDYAALKEAILAIAGLNDLELVIDGKTPASVPEGRELRAEVGLTVKRPEVP